MAFKAEIDIEGKKYSLRHCSYSISRDASFNGFPASDIFAGQISFTILSTTDTGLYQWSIDPGATKKGSITFYKGDGKTSLKTLNFEEAYLIQYTESFQALGDEPMMQDMTLSAKKISFGQATHENDWTEEGS